MNEMKMPVVFSGHGSPMVALDDNEITREMGHVGDQVLIRYGRPKAILAISGHWYVGATYVQSAMEPRQVYDMYGFPQALYDLKYPVKGHGALTEAVQAALGDAVTVNDAWGIDHGTWTVLVHMFPDADIPVVQLSVNQNLDAKASYELGSKLAGLREQGFMIFGSGNVVHNLGRVEWDNEGGTSMAERFNDAITGAIVSGDVETVLEYDRLPDAQYAVPTPDHFLPLLYCLGAAKGDSVLVFNNLCNLGSMAMTGYVWG